MRIGTACDLLAVLAEVVNDVRQDPAARSVEKARAVAAVGGVILRALEQAELAGRVEALEAAAAKPWGEADQAILDAIPTEVLMAMADEFSD